MNNALMLHQTLAYSSTVWERAAVLVMSVGKPDSSTSRFALIGSDSLMTGSNSRRMDHHLFGRQYMRASARPAALRGGQ